MTAFNFPNDPPIGAEANGYIWDGAAWIVPTGNISIDTGAFLTIGTPVAATGSTHPQTIPDWFAGAPIIEMTGDAVVSAAHRGCWLHMMNDVGSLIMLPNDWLPGQAFGARQVGLGQVMFQVDSGATMQMPSTRAEHTIIAERYEDVVFRVVGLSSGYSVWVASGGTA